MTIAATEKEERSRVVEAIELALGEAECLAQKLTNAIKAYNALKSHEYYVPLPKVRTLRARRTRRDNLRIISLYVPQTQVPENLEYIHIATYVTSEAVAELYHFRERYDFITRILKSTMNSSSPKGVTANHHSFIYFIGWGFRAGVYDEVRQINAFYKDRGFNWRVRLVELRYDNSLYNEVDRDLTRYLGIRALRLLNSVGSRNPTIFSRPKHFVDFILLVLAHLSKNRDIIYEVEYLAQRYEVNIREYEKLLFQLGVSSEGRTEEAPIAAAPVAEVAAPTITYRKESLSKDSELAEFWARYEEADVDEEYYERR